MWPVLLACQSEMAYIAACRELCRVLGRQPQYPHNDPTESGIAASCVSIIERRTITEMMRGHAPDAAELITRMGYTGRTGMPITWAEREKIIRPWAMKPERCESCVSVAQMGRFLGRNCDDWEMLVDAGNAVLKSPPAKQNREIPQPFERGRGVLDGLIGGFLDDPRADLYAELYQFMGP